MDQTPALTPERVLRRLQWRVLRRLDGQLHGDYRALLRGTGLDFLDLREYEPGDDLRHIDWNVTARTDTPYVREYAPDREVTGWLLLDRSASMGFGPVDRQKHLVLTELAGALAQLLGRGGSSVGAVLFDNAVEQVVPPGRGRRQVLRILDALLRPAPASRGPTDLGLLLHAAGAMVRRRSVVVLVSDFLTEPGWEAPLARLARRHDVLVLQVVDPRELDLPAVGMVYVEDPETGEQIFVDTDDPAFRQRLRAKADERQAQLVAAARSAGTDLFSIGTDEDLVRALVRVAELRKRSRP